MSLKLKISIPLILLAMLLSACNTQVQPTTPNEHDHDDHLGETIALTPVDLAEGEKLKVLATTNIVGDLVHNVGGDKIALTTMLPVGADPHTYVPTPQDITAVVDAHLVFINGLQLEEFLTELISNALGTVPIVSLSLNVDTQEFEEMDGAIHGEEGPEEDHQENNEEGHHDEHEDEEHAHSGADPHIWLSPANVLVMVENIEHALGELDPSNAATYEANATAYKTQLEELDAWVMAQIATIPPENRKLVTDHDAFAYYADRYGLEIIGTIVPAYGINSESSAQAFADLQETIKLTEARAIFVGSTVNPTLAERIATDTGIKLVPLYTGSLSEAGQGADSYIELIRYNTTAIVEALK